MIVPALITAAVLGGIYLWAPRADAPRPEGQERPTRVIPMSDIPTSLQTRMQNAFIQLPPQLQQQLPQAAWGDPRLWAQAAQVLNALQPGSPQSPELLAISNALATLPLPQPIPIPQAGPVPIPPQLLAQLQQTLAGLPPPFNTYVPLIPPPPATPGVPALPFQVDPAQLVLLASQIEAALGAGRPEPSQLRSIAAQLASTPAARMNGAMNGGVMNGIMNGAMNGVAMNGDMPPIAGVPARVAGEPGRYALHPSAFQRRRYAQAYR